MASSVDDPTFWREQAFECEAAGNMIGAVRLWMAAIAAARRQAETTGSRSELEWLQERLASAKKVAAISTTARFRDTRQ